MSKEKDKYLIKSFSCFVFFFFNHAFEQTLSLQSQHAESFDQFHATKILQILTNKY